MISAVGADTRGWHIFTERNPSLCSIYPITSLANNALFFNQSSNNQVAPQEVEIASYLASSVKNDISDIDFSTMW